MSYIFVFSHSFILTWFLIPKLNSMFKFFPNRRPPLKVFHKPLDIIWSQPAVGRILRLFNIYFLIEHGFCCPGLFWNRVNKKSPTWWLTLRQVTPPLFFVLACADSSTDTKQNTIVGSKVTKLQSYTDKSLKVTMLHIYKVPKLHSYKDTKLPSYQVSKFPSYQVTKLPSY